MADSEACDFHSSHAELVKHLACSGNAIEAKPQQPAPIPSTSLKASSSGLNRQDTYFAQWFLSDLLGKYLTKRKRPRLRLESWDVN
jgi:hypothetical protein